MSKLSEHAKALKQLNGSNVDVGWFENATYDDGKSVAAVAIAAEFGSKNRPARPLLRQSAVVIENKLPGFIARCTVEVLQGGLTPDQFKGQMGEALIATVQDTLKAADFVPLAESTIKAKGFSTILVDTGLLGQSITSRVNEK